MSPIVGDQVSAEGGKMSPILKKNVNRLSRVGHEQQRQQEKGTALSES